MISVKNNAALSFPMMYKKFALVLFVECCPRVVQRVLAFEFMIYN